MAALTSQLILHVCDLCICRRSAVYLWHKVVIPSVCFFKSSVMSDEEWADVPSDEEAEAAVGSDSDDSDIAGGVKSNGKKKVRGVDHFSENGAKAVTGFMEKVRTQGLDWLVVMALALMQCHHKVTLSKRDVKRAFRNCPLNQTYKELMAIVFPYNGKVMPAQHLAAPFGSVSAVYAWDRLSNAIANIILRATKAACAKWVDDFFCSHRSDVELHGMKVLDEFFSLLGLATDVDKAVTNAEEMEVLGVQAKVDNVQQYISTRLAEDKAHKYSHHLEQCVACDYMTPGEAQKIASRFQFATSCAQDNIGRAWIRPFYAQGNDPMQNCRVSNWARQASWWWVLYCA